MSTPEEKRQRADAHRAELRETFRTYDPERIAAVATEDEIHLAYNAGRIGPHVTEKALELRRQREEIKP